MTANTKETQVLLKAAIENAFNAAEDQSFDDVFDDIIDDMEKKGYTADYKIVNNGRWVSDGKYEMLEDAVVKVVVDGDVFFADIGQSRSGSAFTDYYYDNAYLGCLMTEAEYNAPVVKHSFDYKEKKVMIMSDGSAKVDDVAYPSVEAAIDAVIAM